MACDIYKAGGDKNAVSDCEHREAVHFFNPRRVLKVFGGEDEPFGHQVYRQL